MCFNKFLTKKKFWKIWPWGLFSLVEAHFCVIGYDYVFRRCAEENIQLEPGKPDLLWWTLSNNLCHTVFLDSILFSFICQTYLLHHFEEYPMVCLMIVAWGQVGGGGEFPGSRDRVTVLKGAIVHDCHRLILILLHWRVLFNPSVFVCLQMLFLLCVF